jgi:hypothetical protein
MLWAAMAGGALFMYLTAMLLTRSRGAAVLAGVAYMSAPYMLVNVHIRGAFTEVMGQGLLPVILYCTLRCYMTRGLSPWFFACGLSWGMLALTHNITFVAGSLFVGLFLFSIDVRRWRLTRDLWRVGVAYATGLLLAIYMLAPMASANYLSILDSMAVTWSRWMTPLSTLLSPVSLPPEPQPGHAALDGLNPSIGLPALLAVFVVAYASWARSSPIAAEGALRPRRICAVLVALFLLAMFMTWTPIDFWPYTPKVLRIAQFTYRWLAPATWIAALAIAYAVVLLFPARLGPAHVAVGTLLIVMSHSSFLRPLRASQVTIAEIVKKADIGYGTIDYLMNQRAVHLSVADGGDFEVPAVDNAQHLIIGQPAALPRDRILAANNPELVLAGNVIGDLAAGNAPAVTVFIDGRPVFAKRPDATGAIEIRVPLKPLLDVPAPAPPTAQVAFATEPARVPVAVTRLVVRGLGLEGAIPVESMGPLCARQGLTVACHITVANHATNVQLPLLFYPDLLDVRVNGATAPYFPLRSEPFLLASVRLDPGVYDVTGRFRGLAWANTISAIAWIAMLSGFIYGIFVTYQRVMSR